MKKVYKVFYSFVFTLLGLNKLQSGIANIFNAALLIKVLHSIIRMDELFLRQIYVHMFLKSLVCVVLSLV